MATQTMDRIVQARLGRGVIPGRYTAVLSVPGTAIVSQVVDDRQLVEPCCTCASRNGCPAARLLMLESRRPNYPYLHSRTLTRGQHVFHEGDGLESLYVVKSGSIKTCLTSAAGDEQVVSFHLPGELLGVDALGTSVHGTSTMALESTAVCAVPFADHEEFIRHSPAGLSWFLGLAGGELVRDHHTSLMLNKMNAEARLSHFLLDLSRRFRERRYSAREFNLSMSRQDIGNHLGLTVETVSRLMTRFQQDGLLEVDRRRITIRDAASLGAMAGIPCRGRMQ